ncbi:isopentenyl-diphosphate Delta-isomerase [Pararhodobacter zhoushanensis]|uniref:Isopentenyl-diphosphate Delta-isomerase n=1 Tax=Pararhodobacter zhoushanensis TaxID=2479545 RepID=A0ABT3GUR9_9RHOB|nr:isopentenyl-diphosphate Delta-isomerase [Pararhodobacter zhoushanensis]MCW1931265.1 isopentenyl-diphosphate Delta-isomerase [Pararhodobacter zhoushanensis]
MQQDIPVWIDGALRPMDKLTVHQRGLKHPAVSIFVVAGGRLLIQRRALAKYHTPGLWANTCCTHPLWGETPLDCAQRRLEQELGLTGVALQHRGVVEYRAPVGHTMIEHEVVDLFLGICDAEPALTPNPDEVMDTRWIDTAELHDQLAQRPQDFTPWLRIYLAEHADLVLAGF